MFGAVLRKIRSAWRRLGSKPRRAIKYVLALSVVSVLSVNAGVRCAGGGPSLLSISFLPQKVEALGLLARHVLFAGDDERPPTWEVRQAAGRHRVPVCFALAVARVESGFRPHVISSAGAMGLMQLMPGTARGLNVSDPFKASDNADGGVRYLRKLLRRYGGDRSRAAAAYHAGPGAVPKKGRLPRFTQSYVRRVMAQPCRPPATAGGRRLAGSKTATGGGLKPRRSRGPLKPQR